MTADVELMESIDALFSSNQDLGCGASYQEFVLWYEDVSSGIQIIESELEGNENQPNDAFFVLSLYEQYQAVCDGTTLDPIEEVGGESVDLSSLTEENNVEEAGISKLGMLATGGALLYLLLNTKKKWY